MPNCAKHLFFPLLSFFVHISTACAQYLAEKIYMQFDKSYYVAGETCWFKAYVVQQDLHFSELSGVLYVDWIDEKGNILKHQKLKIYAGEAEGDFTFESVAASAQYTVRAYTNYMRNEDDAFFFTKPIFVYGQLPAKPDSTVANPVEQIDLQFFPEGGSAVEGLQTNIAFKAINSSGYGKNVSGQIIDESNNPVATLQSIHKGMGVFPYIPSGGKRYRAKLSTGEIFALPEARSSGVVMNVNNHHPEKIYARVHSSRSVSFSGFTLVGLSGGRPIFKQQIKAPGNETTVVIPKKDIPGGIFQLTLYDPQNIPLAERIVFIKSEKIFKVEFESIDKPAGARDSVSFVVRTTDRHGRPVETSLSLSVVDDFFIEQPRENILTRLLLQSDIKGNVEDPGWYFQNNSEAAYALDLVMMTNGWRKYDTMQQIRYPVEKGLTLAGIVRRKGTNRPISRAKLTLLVTGTDFNGIHSTESDSSGAFLIEGVDFSDSSKLIWQIQNQNDKMLEADVVIQGDTNIPVFNPRHVQTNNIAIGEKARAIVPDEVTGRPDAQVLEEVVITRRRRSGQVGYDSRMIKPGKDDHKLMAYTFISQYAIGLPHAKPIEMPDGSGTRWVTPFNGPIKYVINGFPVDDNSPSASPFSVLNSFRTDEIEYVIVNGDPHAGYTIIVKTRMEEVPKPGIFRQRINGYQWTRSFYHPKYGPGQPVPGSDNRTTLYWNPYLVTDANGVAIVSFYNSDSAKRFHVTAEGLWNGHIGTGTTIF